LLLVDRFSLSVIPGSQNVYCLDSNVFPLFISELYFSDLTYTDIYVDGQIDGVRNLSLGQGVNFVIGENVCHLLL